MIAEHCGEDHDENKEGNKMKIDEKKENIEVKVENVVVKVEKHVILDSEMLYDYFDESAPKKQEFCCNFPGCNRIFKRHDGIKKHLLTHGNANKVEVTTLNSDSFNDGEGNALSSGDTFTEDKVTIHFKNTAEEPVTLNTGDTSMEVTGTNKREFPCIFPKCGKTFGRPDRLKKHMLIHDNIRQYVCAIISCGKSYTTAQHLRRHNAAAHGSSPDVFATIHCDQENCFKKFQSKYSMKKHFQKCHISGGRVRYTCDVCIERFFYQADYYAHMYQMHGIKLLKCDKCDLVFTTNTEKNRHMRGHRTWICEEPECYGATFDRYNDKRKHDSIFHPLLYICHHCNFQTQRKFFLEEHMYSKHLPRWEKELILCSFADCNRTFQHSRNYLQHFKKKHLNEESHFVCPLGCPQTFATKQSCQRHVIKMHEQKVGLPPEELPYPCDNCHKKFGKEKNLRRHFLRVHAQPSRPAIENLVNSVFMLPEFFMADSVNQNKSENESNTKQTDKVDDLKQDSYGSSVS